MRVFFIEEQSRYYVKLVEIQNIEDAGDDFITEDDAVELLGKTPIAYRSFHEFFLKERIVSELSTLKQEMLKKGKKSTIIRDEELVEVLKKSPNSWEGGKISDYVEGLRRVGNRLSLHKKKEKTDPNKRDAKWFLDLCMYFLRDKHLLHLELRGSTVDNVSQSSITFIRSVVNWKEFEEWFNFNKDNGPHFHLRNYFTADNLKLYKQVYDNPAMFRKDEEESIVDHN